jgi:oxygen-dependent protoporphyrinogen oxidase
MSAEAEHYDVVIVGGGIAGMAAAMRLRERRLLILESERVVGGRTLSREWRGHWANVGAQAITNDDKVRMTELANEVGCTLENRVMGGGLSQWPTLSKAAAADVAETDRRLDAEAANPRDETLPELDDQTMAEFLGDISEEALGSYERWMGSMMTASTFEVSLHGALILHGDQWSTPWSTDEVAHTGRGPSIVMGGTHQIALGAAAIVGEGLIQVDAFVSHIEPSSAGIAARIAYQTGGEEHEVTADRVIVATPAPVVSQIIPGLPESKQQALGRVRYGRMLSTPIFLVGTGESPEPPLELTSYRPDVDYLHPGVQTVDVAETEDAFCINAYLYDVLARPVWDDPDHTIATGVVHALYEIRPELTGRVHHVEVKRFRSGIPHYYPGRVKNLPTLIEPFGGLHFCGDYTNLSNAEGAIRSGERAAEEVLSAL